MKRIWAWVKAHPMTPVPATVFFQMEFDRSGLHWTSWLWFVPFFACLTAVVVLMADLPVPTRKDEDAER